MRLSTDEARDLLKQAQAGNKAALDKLACCCRPYALAVCRTFYRDPRKADEADEAAQDALIRFFACIHKVDPDGDWVAFLATVTKNICLTRLRKQSRIEKFFRQLVSPTEAGQPDPILDVPTGIRSDPLAPLIESELYEDVEHCLGCANEFHRTILELHYLAGMPASEIRNCWPAGEIPPKATFYTWLNEAKAAMGRCLDGRGLAGDAKKIVSDLFRDSA